MGAKPSDAGAAGASDSGKAPVTPPYRWRAAVIAGVSAAVLVLDQATKALVRAQVVDASFSLPILPGVMRLEFVMNRGASFGMGQGHGWLFVLMAAAVVAGIAAYAARARLMSKVEVVGLALVLGGAIGNAIDRVSLGYVTDFLCTEFIDFPVFNVADIGIVCGAVLALVGFIFLSPVNAVDATAELNRRDAEARERKARRGGRRP